MKKAILKIFFCIGMGFLATLALTKIQSKNTYVDKPAFTELSTYTFRTDYLKKEHFEKHGKETGYKDADSYEKRANEVINSEDALIKTEKEDGDYVYYIVDTNEIVFLSRDGYIRTYFKPDSGKKYFDIQ